MREMEISMLYDLAPRRGAYLPGFPLTNDHYHIRQASLRVRHQAYPMAQWSQQTTRTIKNAGLSQVVG